MLVRIVSSRCCALALAAICSIAAAQAADLAQAADSAWKRSVERAASAARSDVALARRAAAEALWAAPPSVELSHRGDPLPSSAAARETEIGLAWPLLLPAQRAARGASAEADVAAAQAAEREARLAITGEVRTAAWALNARDAELTLAAAEAEVLAGLAGDVERRVAAGVLARADALAARAESLAAHAAEVHSRQRRDAALADWRLLTGSEAAPDAIEALAATLSPDHPRLSSAREAVQAARLRVELTHATRRDPPELSLRYRRESAPGLAAQDGFGVALRLPFGTDDRNRPREAEALATLDVARAQEERLRRRLENALDTARAAAAAAERQLAAEASRAALLQERAQLVERSFRAGETSLPELLRARAAAAQAGNSLARQRAEFGLARAQTQQAAGAMP